MSVLIAGCAYGTSGSDSAPTTGASTNPTSELPATVDELMGECEQGSDLECWDAVAEELSARAESTPENERADVLYALGQAEANHCAYQASRAAWASFLEMAGSADVERVTEVQGTIEAYDQIGDGAAYDKAVAECMGTPAA